MDCSTQDQKIEEVAGKITTATKNVLQDLCSKWKCMYDFTPEMMDQRFTQFNGYVVDLYDEILKSVDNKKAEMEKQLEEKLQERLYLQKELEVSIDTDFDESLPMTKILALIDEAMKEFREIRDSRLARLKTLRGKEKILCDHMALPCFPPTKEVPTEEELARLEESLLKLNEEKLKRQDEFICLKKKIIKKFQLLEKEARSDFEKEVFCGCEESFKLTQENLTRLRDLDNTTETIYETAVAKREELVNKLQNLWERIREEEKIRNVFLTKNSGVGPSTLEKLSEEIKRCEEIKMANMKAIIKSIRVELEQWWNKLSYSEDQREKFHPFLSEVYTEEVLDLHEAELDRLKKFYEDNLPIFELAEKRDELWLRMLHLDELAQDKNRLFNNRGGQLLKEEKERKKIETNLPKIDKQLQLLLVDFEEREGHPFIWNGFNLLVKIVNDWEDRKNEKELKKLVKKAEHQKMLEIESKLGTRSAQKRKHPTTPKSNVSSKALKRSASTDSFSNSMSSAGNRTMTLSSKDPWSAKTKVGIVSSYGYTITRSRQGTPIAPKIIDISIASYTHFQEEIQEKSQELQSQAAPRRRLALKEVNSPIVAHSSPTTTPPKKLKTPLTTSARKPVVSSANRLRKTPGRTTPGRLVSTPRTIPRLTPARTHIPLNI